MKKIQLPLEAEALRELRAGDRVLLSGVLYTARDAAHKKMIQALENEEALPFDMQGQTLYYVGPAPAKPGAVIGSAGPTTSGRMDAFTPKLLSQGLAAMVGKGKRSETVNEEIRKNGAVYFAAVGGAAARIASAINSVEVIAYEELGTEAVRKLTIKDFPVIVAVDSEGNDYYQLGRKAYLDLESR